MITVIATCIPSSLYAAVLFAVISDNTFNRARPSAPARESSTISLSIPDALASTGQLYAYTHKGCKYNKPSRRNQSLRRTKTAFIPVLIYIYTNILNIQDYLILFRIPSSSSSELYWISSTPLPLVFCLIFTLAPSRPERSSCNLRTSGSIVFV